MTTENSLETKSKKIIWRTIKFLLGSFFVLIGILYFISTSKFENLIPELITHYAQEKYDVNLNFASYETSRSENFPFLTFKMKGLYVEGPDCMNCDNKLLTINNLQFKIQPWDLLLRFVHIKDLRIEGARVLLHKEEKVTKKSSSLEKSITKNSESLQKIRLKTISLEDVFVEYKDNIKNKYFGVNFKEADVLIHPKKEKIDITIDADCFFKGLTFKQENGAFLKDKDAKLLLNLEFSKDSINLKNSSIQVKKDTLQLAANYQRAEDSSLELYISSSGILLDNALPLLNTKLQNQLSPFKIDKKLQANLHLSSYLKPDIRPAIDLDFQTTNANLDLSNIQVTNMDFQANYSNHCRTKGDKIQRGEDCLTIHSISGNLFDTHPINLSGVIHDLKKLNLEIAGTTILDLPSLQPYLTQTSYEFKKGKAELDIDYRGDLGRLLQGALTKNSKIKIGANLQNTAFTYNGLPFTNLSGNLLFEAQKTSISNLRATYKNTPFSLNGHVDNLIELALNKRGKLQSDLRLDVTKIDTKNFLIKDNEKEHQEINPATLFSAAIEDITQTLEGKIAVRINEFAHQKTLAKNSSFSLFLKAPKDIDSQKDVPNFFRIESFKTTLFDSLQIEADIFINDINKLNTIANFKVNSGFSDLRHFVKNENIKLLNGQLTIDATSNFLLKDLQNLSIAKAKEINLDGKINISNAAFTLQKNQYKFTNLNTALSINADSLYINNLRGKAADIEVELTGNINNYLALLTEEKTTAQADLNLHLGTIDTEQNQFLFNKELKFTPQVFLQSLKPTLSKISGQTTIKIDELKIPNYPINDIVFNLTTGKNKTNSFFLNIENIEALLYGRTPIYADLKITNFATPKLDLTAKSDMPITEFNTLMQDDNFQSIKGLVSVEFAYKNTINDSFNLQDYLLTGDIKARVGFRDAEIYYEPRGLRFSELNGGVSFTEENMTVDFPRMLFNDNVVHLSGDSHDFLPFFFEENKDFTVDLTLNSPLINFHKFDTPKTLKEKGNIEVLDTEQDVIDSPIDRLLTEGNLSLVTKIDKVIYDNFYATNIIGRAKVNDNEVVLDTFKMRTSGGVFGISSTISDIDKEKIHLTADITMSEIDASKVLKSFNNFKQTTLTNKNIIGIVDAEINISTNLNDNYEVFPNAMAGNLELMINRGAFIDFNGLKNLDGFLFKKRRLNAVYFDTLRTNILLSGRDMEFSPTVLNSTAATLTVEGLYTFSEEDKTDLIIEVPLGNIFTRYVERAKIRKYHKKRTGLPIIVEVTEKDKILEFNIQLRRDDEDK